MEGVKRYRFFYHYYRQYKCLSLHFRGKCHKVSDIVCEVPCESKWSNRQPNLVMRGFATGIEIEKGIARIF